MERIGNRLGDEMEGKEYIVEQIVCLGCAKVVNADTRAHTGLFVFECSPGTI